MKVVNILILQQTSVKFVLKVVRFARLEVHVKPANQVIIWIQIWNVWQIVLQELTKTLQDFVLHVYLHVQRVVLIKYAQIALQDIHLMMENAWMTLIQFVHQIVRIALPRINVFSVKMDII